MSTLKLIVTAIGSALGLAAIIVIGLFLWQIKGELRTKRTEQAIADSVRMQGQIDELNGRLVLRDAEANRTHTVFYQAKAQQAAKPIVTGGGPKADSIANTAINACFEKATNALTACEVARKTADSLPALKDSLSRIEKTLAGLRGPSRWTAKGSVFYAWPMKKPMVGVWSDFKVPLLPLTATAGADYLIMGAPSTPIDSALSKQKWRAYIGASVPFR